MKFEIIAKKENEIRKEVVFSETQAFICIQELYKQGYKDIGMREIED